MKTLFLILLSAVAFSSCSSSKNSSKNLSKDYKENPCEDARYLKLKEMKMSDMTGAESEYFKTKTIKCEDYERRAKTKLTTIDVIVVSSILVAIALLVATVNSLGTH
jgi:PBP1b-binding outer membrane lipoprotein LpoB